MEEVYWRDWPKIVSSKMTGDEKKSMVSMLNQALKNPLSEWFRLPGVSSVFLVGNDS